MSTPVGGPGPGRFHGYRSISRRRSTVPTAVDRLPRHSGLRCSSIGALEPGRVLDGRAPPGGHTASAQAAIAAPS